MTGSVQQAGFSLDTVLGGISASSTIEAIKGVWQEPTANTRLSLLVLTAVVLLLLLFIVIVLMLVTPSRKRVVKIRRYTSGRPPSATGAAGAAAAVGEGATSAGRESRPPGKAFLVLTGPLFVSLLVLVGLLALYVGTSTNAYCTKTCHANSVSAMRAEKIGHAACVECHESGRLLGVFSNVSSRARMVWDYMMGTNPSVAEVAVDSRTCTGCHHNVAHEVVASRNGVRMSHEEVISAGQPCTVCHARAGHTRVSYTSSMSACLPCHNTRTASAECDTCHTKDPIAAMFSGVATVEALGSGKFVYPAVRAANRDCGGCHDQAEQCDACHGIRMPHSQEFKTGGHARPAAFDLKLACWRCHDPQWCSNGNCHSGAFDPGTGNTSHPGNWEQEHKTASWDAGCVCHQGRTPRTAPICTLCHAADRSLLPIRQ